jgi:transposase-like protein
MDRKELSACIRSFVRDRTIAAMLRDAHVSHGRAEALVHAFRRLMASERLPVFSGIVEMDETYIGGQRKNKRLHIRCIRGKRGHGTEKLPILGIFHRDTGRVWIKVMPTKCDWRGVLREADRRIAKGSRVYTDGYQAYQPLSDLGYVHRWVEHNAGEYVRGDVHTNNIEGFWGIMKRRMSCIGGMRRDRLGLFAAEIAWRFNHRKDAQEKKERALLRLVLGERFGG